MYVEPDRNKKNAFRYFILNIVILTYYVKYTLILIKGDMTLLDLFLWMNC